MQRLGRYELLGRLGRGSTAEVLAAQLTGPGGFVRRVAIKRMHPELAQRPRFRELLLVEARLAATLEHRNIVQVYELLEEGDELLVVMEYADGGSLRTLLQAAGGRPVPWPVVAQIGAEVCAALSHLHRLCDLEGRPLELVHRDVSPENVLLTRSGGVKLADFGIARARGLEQRAGREIIGHVQYMPAEQQLDLGADEKVDVFALGAVLYELATGAPPFPHGHALAKERGERPVHLAERCPDFPRELCDRLMAALADDPAQRPTAEALSVGITRVIGNTSSTTLLGALARYVTQLVPTPPIDRLEELTLPERPAVSRREAGSSVRLAQLQGLEAQLRERAGLFSIVGPPGSGTSTAAREVAQALGRQVFFVACTNRSEEQTLEALAESLGVTIPDARSDAGLSKALACVADAVLVLDDVSPALASLAGRVATAAASRVLVAATAPVGLPQERVLRLAPLSVDEAVVMLERGLGAGVASREALASIAGRLDGTPLELGVAIDALRVSRPETLALRLAQGEGLTGTPSPAAARAFERVWSGLNADEQTLVGALSVFHGGFTVEAAGAVATHEDPQVTSEALERLLTKSVVVTRRQTAPPSKRTPSLRRLRYAVPEWFRQRVVQHLGARLDPARERHAHHFIRSGSSWLAGAPGHLGAAFREMLRDEAENLLAVHQRSLQAFPLTGDAVNHALSAALMLAPWLSQVGPFERVAALLDSALAVAEPLDCHPPLFVRALVARAELHRRRGALSDAEHDVTRAMQRCDALKDPRLLAETLLVRAALCIDRTHHEQAATALDQVHQFLLVHDDERLGAQVHASWALLALEHGDFEASLDSAKTALERYRALGDERYEAVCLASLGAVHLEQGRFGAARSNHVAAITTLDSLDDRYSAALVRGYLGLDELFSGDDAAAARALEAATTALSTMGELRYLALFRAWLAVVQKQWPLAERVALVNESLAVLSKLGDAVFGWTVRVLAAVVRGAAAPPPGAEHPERDNDVRLARRFAHRIARA
ncbi:MAG: serine/threonine-protein kinase [Archangiaceae bacterium]|nr:serine/threonine-protein kinase [Archangiaceae bacterium]